jgi:hypothetical protein
MRMRVLSFEMGIIGDAIEFEKEKALPLFATSIHLESHSRLHLFVQHRATALHVSSWYLQCTYQDSHPSRLQAQKRELHGHTAE